MLSNVHCFVLCFAIENRHSIQELSHTWLPKMIQHTKAMYRGSTPPFVLVGVRSTKTRVLSLVDCRALAVHLGAYGGRYYEYNALNGHLAAQQQVVREVFQVAGRASSGQVVVGGGKRRSTRGSGMATQGGGCCVIN
jgi:hypothetical protein